MINQIMYSIFINAIRNEDIKSIKLMLGNRVKRESWSDKLRYILYKNIDIHRNKENAFYIAYMQHSNDIVKYLLEIGEKTNNRIDIHVDNNYAIKKICNNGNIELVKYLIEYCYRINDNFTNDFASI